MVRGHPTASGSQERTEGHERRLVHERACWSRLAPVWSRRPSVDKADARPAGTAKRAPGGKERTEGHERRLIQEGAGWSKRVPASPVGHLAEVAKRTPGVQNYL